MYFGYRRLDMFKNIIAPVQAWLLSRGQCVGCGAPLSKGKRTADGSEREKVSCKCGRIFIYDKKNKRYHRALFEEV
jgi:hypothetical protein